MNAYVNFSDLANHTFSRNLHSEFRLTLNYKEQQGIN